MKREISTTQMEIDPGEMKRRQWNELVKELTDNMFDGRSIDLMFDCFVRANGNYWEHCDMTLEEFVRALPYNVDYYYRDEINSVLTEDNLKEFERDTWQETLKVMRENYEEVESAMGMNVFFGECDILFYLNFA